MSALDAQLRESLRRQVKRIQSELEITTVYVTHDQAEALAISDRVAVMNGGRVEQVGRPQEIYREPATRFVAEFVGDNNVFDGEVRSREARVRAGRRRRRAIHAARARRNRSVHLLRAAGCALAVRGAKPADGERRDQRISAKPSASTVGGTVGGSSSDFPRFPTATN